MILRNSGALARLIVNAIRTHDTAMSLTIDKENAHQQKELLKTVEHLLCHDHADVAVPTLLKKIYNSLPDIH